MGEQPSIRQSILRTLGDGGRVALAVSGGIDSMVLLHAAAGIVPSDRLLVATFDHGTGAHSARAAELVARTAAALGLECVSDRAHRTLASEAELRVARWTFLDSVVADYGAVVATAHTADDQIETVLMRVLRGAGARGLAGLAARGRVLRPLLEFTRADIEDYAQRERIDWLEDPSNASRRFLRNRVRHDLLPALRRVCPTIDADLLCLGRAAATWRADMDAFVEEAVSVRSSNEHRGLDIPIETLAELTTESLRVVLPAIVAGVGVVLDRRGIVRLAGFAARARVGSRAPLTGGWEVVRSRDALQLRASSEATPTPAELALSHPTIWSTFSFEPAAAPQPKNLWTACLPTDRPLFIRSWRPGDVMRNPSSGRLRKVKHLLSKARVTGHERATWPVVVAGDEIIWIPGVRRSDAAADPTGRSGLSFICEYVNR